jgi:hypothetical protein
VRADSLICVGQITPAASDLLTCEGCTSKERSSDLSANVAGDHAETRFYSYNLRFIGFIQELECLFLAVGTHPWALTLDFCSIL